MIVNSPFQRARRVVNGRRASRRHQDNSSSSSSSSSGEGACLSASTSSTSSNGDIITPKITILDNSNEQPKNTRQCWICYGEESPTQSNSAPTNDNVWVSPCQCRGTTKWVHQGCLLDWIDSQISRSGASNNNQDTEQPITPLLPSTRSFDISEGPLVVEDAKLACPQCHTPYHLHQAYLLPRPVLQLIDRLASLKERLLIWSTLGLLSSALYTLAFSQGAWSGWVIGGPEFLQWIADSYRLGPLARLQVSLGVPLVPFYLLSTQFRAFEWLYPLLPALVYRPGPGMFSFNRVMIVGVPIVWSVKGFLERLIFRWRSDSDSSTIAQSPSQSPSLQSPTQSLSQSLSQMQSLSRSTESLSSIQEQPSTIRISILSTTAALLLPLAASLTGKLLTRLLAPNLRLSQFACSLLGGVVLVAVRDAGRLLYFYQIEGMRKYRRVLPYTG